MSIKNTQPAEELRLTLDFEGTNDVYTTALLFQLWLKELPEPILWSHVAAELLASHHGEYTHNVLSSTLTLFASAFNSSFLLIIQRPVRSL